MTIVVIDRAANKAIISEEHADGFKSIREVSAVVADSYIDCMKRTMSWVEETQKDKFILSGAGA